MQFPLFDDEHTLDDGEGGEEAMLLLQIPSVVTGYRYQVVEAPSREKHLVLGLEVVTQAEAEKMLADATVLYQAKMVAWRAKKKREERVWMGGWACFECDVLSTIVVTFFVT